MGRYWLVSRCISVTEYHTCTACLSVSHCMRNKTYWRANYSNHDDDVVTRLSQRVATIERKIGYLSRSNRLLQERLDRAYGIINKTDEGKTSDITTL